MQAKRSPRLSGRHHDWTLSLSRCPNPLLCLARPSLDRGRPIPGKENIVAVSSGLRCALGLHHFNGARSQADGLFLIDGDHLLAFLAIFLWKRIPEPFEVSF